MNHTLNGTNSVQPIYCVRNAISKCTWLALSRRRPAATSLFLNAGNAVIMKREGLAPSRTRRRLDHSTRIAP
jgi:hypothetical protein